MELAALDAIQWEPDRSAGSRGLTTAAPAEVVCPHSHYLGLDFGGNVKAGREVEAVAELAARVASGASEPLLGWSARTCGFAPGALLAAGGAALGALAAGAVEAGRPAAGRGLGGRGRSTGRLTGASFTAVLPPSVVVSSSSASSCARTCNAFATCSISAALA